MIRKFFFWLHLSAGVSAGLVILMMSVTGVLLTYERQIIGWLERGMYAETSYSDAVALPLEQLLDAVKTADSRFKPTAVVVQADPLAPVLIRSGRTDAYHVDRYTGAVLDNPAKAADRFFAMVTGWHRWFNVDRDNRDLARAVTGAGNLLFLFLIVSGLYLWIPRFYRWIDFRKRLLLDRRVHSARARDFNWHHVFGIWMALPLAVIVVTAVVFSYGWANSLVYRAFGEAPPMRGGSAAGSETPVAAAAQPGATLLLDALLSVAATELTGWRTMQLQLPEPGSSRVQIGIDSGTGGQPQHRVTLELNRVTGEIVGRSAFNDSSPARQTRSIIRFLHTGEVLGIGGQTLAGVASGLSVLMVWTGLALAWRRLITPSLRRRARRATQ